MGVQERGVGQRGDGCIDELRYLITEASGQEDKKIRARVVNAVRFLLDDKITGKMSGEEIDEGWEMLNHLGGKDTAAAIAIAFFKDGRGDATKIETARGRRRNRFSEPRYTDSCALDHLKRFASIDTFQNIVLFHCFDWGEGLEEGEVQVQKALFDLAESQGDEGVSRLISKVTNNRFAIRSIHPDMRERFFDLVENNMGFSTYIQIGWFLRDFERDQERRGIPTDVDRSFVQGLKDRYENAQAEREKFDGGKLNFLSSLGYLAVSNHIKSLIISETGDIDNDASSQVMEAAIYLDNIQRKLDRDKEISAEESDNFDALVLAIDTVSDIVKYRLLPREALFARAESESEKSIFEMLVERCVRGKDQFSDEERIDEFKEKLCKYYMGVRSPNGYPYEDYQARELAHIAFLNIREIVYSIE